VYAEQILEHLGLAGYFEATCGAGLDGSSRYKHEVITAALKALAPVETGGAVMVGDRDHDIIGARRCGLRAVGVTWGYGDPAELLAAGADTLVASPGELSDLLAG